jgi:hypothetical protein
VIVQLHNRRIKLASGYLNISGMIYAPNARVTVTSKNEHDAIAASQLHPFGQLISDSLRIHLDLENVLTEPSDDDVDQCMDRGLDMDDASDTDDACA